MVKNPAGIKWGERDGRSVGEIRRRLRWVYLAKSEKSLSPKTQKNDDDSAVRKIINKLSFVPGMS